MRFHRLIPSYVAALALLFSATTSAHAQFLFTSSDIVQTPLPVGHSFLLNLVPGNAAQLYLTTTSEYYSLSTSNIAQLGSFLKIAAFQPVGIYPDLTTFVTANPGQPGRWGVAAYDANYNPAYYDYTLSQAHARSASPNLSDPGGYLPSIAIALDGTVYTREPNNVISKFTSIFTNSTPALTFGNTGPHALSGSGVIALDTTSNVLYATSFPSAGGALMERFNSSGTYLGSFALPVGTNAVYTVDSQGVVYVADMTGSNGYIYDGATGTQLGEFQGNWTSDVNYAKSKGGVPTIALTANGILAFDTGTGMNLDLLDVSSVNAPGTTLSTGGSAVSQPSITAAGNYTIADSGGSLTLTGTGSSVGQILNVAAGTQLILASGASLSAGVLRLQTDGTNFGSALLGSGSTLSSKLAGSGTLSFDGGTFQAAGDTGLTPISIGSDGATIDSNGRALTDYASMSGTGSLTKQGAGSLVLYGNDSYTGPTTVAGGTLQFGNPNALYGGDTTQWDANHVVVQSGATLAINVGASDEFTADQILTLASGAKLNSGSTFALDTTNAAGGTFLLPGAIADNPAAPLNLEKLGSNTLVLTGASSYTGSTTVSGGSLQFGIDNVLPSSTAVSVSSGATLDLNGHAGSVGSLSGSGSVALGAGSLSVGSDGSSTTFSGVIAGSGSLAKTGSGSLTLSGANTYSGPTSISGGVLNLNGSASNSAFTVASGGTLSGSGSLGPLTVASGGTLSPGNSPGTLSAGNTTFAGGGSFIWQINAASGSQGQNPGWDLLNVNGTLTLSASSFNKFSINLASLTLADSPGAVSDFNPNLSYHFTFLSTSAGISGFDPNAFSLNTSAFSNSFSGSWSISQNGNDLSLNYASAVPEPASYATLVSLASLAFVASRRRKSRRSS